MSRLGAKVRRGTSSVITAPYVHPKVQQRLDRVAREHAWRHGLAFGPHILGAAQVAAWLVVAAIVVACVAAVAGDAPARVRRPVGFDTISEGA